MESHGNKTSIAVENEALRLKVLELLPDLKNREELSQQIVDLIFPTQQ